MLSSWSSKLIPLLVFLCSAISSITAQTADQAWLKYNSRPKPMADEMSIQVRSLGNSVLEKSAVDELRRGTLGLLSPDRAIPLHDVAKPVVLGTLPEIRKEYPSLEVPDHLPKEGYWLGVTTPHSSEIVVGADERGVLYGAFALLRLLTRASDLPASPLTEAPAMPIRWTDEWDNIDGSIERGYGGRSIFFDAGHVRADLAPVTEYARLLASIGINGCNLNNVNNASAFFTPEMLKEIARIADAMRPYGVRVSLSADIASPQKLGGLPTFDPLDPAVKKWWNDKVNEIYSLIPDFGGFTVKADSEGQPGPASYGRSPADAANALAAALAPHNGVVLYRAFVYNHHLDWTDPKADRARAAYDIFDPLDGKFAPNVIVQTKEGPIDFQVREPVSPLFGGLPHTSQAMELQITQEYLGQQRHLVYIAPMWKEVLDFDMRVDGDSTPVRQIISGQSFHRKLGGMIGVACVGQNGWLGSPLALANLYAFGRLTWNPDLKPEDIATEWTRQTISTDPAVVRTVVDMLMQSWPAYENYTGPLGLQTLTDITGSHYGPNVEASERNGWGQWHKADHNGVGFDRSVATGTGYAGQYPTSIAKMYASTSTTPDDLLLLFHHVPYTYKLHDGKTVIQYLYDSHYDGAARAAEFVRAWQSIKAKLDPALYSDVLPRLQYQAAHAIVWRDAITQYFLKLSGIPDAQGRAGNYPDRLEAEDAHLTGYKIIDVDPWEDASRGKAISCEITPSPKHRASGHDLPSSGNTTQMERGHKVSGHDFSRAEYGSKQDGASAPDADHSCSAKFNYTGKPGTFNLAVQYFDLQGGSGKFAISVNGQQGDTWPATDQLPSRRPSGDNSTRHVVHNIALKTGYVIRIEGTPDAADPAALDYIEVLSPTAAP